MSYGTFYGIGSVGWHVSTECMLLEEWIEMAGDSMELIFMVGMLP